MLINVREYRMGNNKMDNPEKVVTLGTHDEEKQTKNTIIHAPSYKQPEVKTNRTSF